jgi:hypothetical protein
MNPSESDVMKWKESDPFFQRGHAKVSDQQKGIAVLREMAKARAEANVERDNRIRQAHASGMTPKQIAGDKGIVGEKGLSASTVCKIIKKPHLEN